MFDDEADTALDVIRATTELDVCEPTRPDGPDTIDDRLAFEDTAPVVIDRRSAGLRLDTNCDWPPAPALPARHAPRYARIYRAISSLTPITGLTALKPSAP